MPVVVENDANAAAWGEYRFGAGVGRPDMIMVTVGTGVGGGMIMGGRLQRRRAWRRGGVWASGDGAEGEAVRVWPPAGAGSSTPAAAHWSATLVSWHPRIALDAEIILSLGDGTPEGIQGLHVTEAAGKGDQIALAAFAKLGLWLGRGMADIAALLDPAVFVIGGGVIESGDLILGPTNESFARNLVAREHRPLTPIEPALLGNAAGIVGAADLARPENRAATAPVAPRGERAGDWKPGKSDRSGRRNR